MNKLKSSVFIVGISKYSNIQLNSLAAGHQFRRKLKDISLRQLLGRLLKSRH